MNETSSKQFNKGVKILGTGSYFPPLSIKNKDFEKFVDTSDEWIATRTGIKERQFCTGKYNHHMAIQACRNTIENANIDVLEIDLILLTTCTPDFSYPSMSCIVQQAVGASKAACIDINLACNGFVTALDIARTYLMTGKYKTIMVVASEKLSSHTDFTDRASCVLFGDGAGAVIVQPSENEYASFLGAMGDDIDNSGLYYKYQHNQNNPFENINNKDNTENEINYKQGVQMDGKAVYKFAVEAMPEAVRTVLSQTNYNIDDIDILIPHQANLRIIQTAAKTLKIPMDRVFINIDKHANTSSACIPICLDELNKAGKLKQGMLICLVGFGGGFTYGSVLMRI